MEGEWLMLTIAALFAALFFHVARYMLARALNNEYMLSSAKAGIESWLDALLLLAVLLLFVELLNGLALTLSNAYGWGSALSVSCTAEDYCLANISSALVERYIEMGRALGKGLGDLPVLTLSSGGFGADTMYAAFANYHLSFGAKISFDVQKRKALLDYISLALAPLSALKAYLLHFAYPLGLLFLYLGVFFKALPYAGRLGGTLIALGLTSLVALPLLTIFFLSPASLYSTTSTQCQCGAPPAGVGDGVVYSDDLYTWAGEGLISYDEANAFLNGSLESISVEGNTYYSCTYYSLPSQQELESYAGADAVVEEYSCSSICRVLPFPNLYQCRKAEPFCRDLYESMPSCMYPSFTSTHLSSYVSYKGQQIPLGEAMADAKCFTVEPLLPFSLQEKDRYPLPIPQSCRYVLVKQGEGGWEASLTEECREFLDKLDDSTRQKVEDILSNYIPSNPEVLVNTLAQWVGDSNNWVAPTLEEVGRGAPPKAFQPIGYIVEGNCSSLDVLPSLLSVPSVERCECPPPAEAESAEGIAYLLALGWGGTGLAVGSSAMFLVSVSMALSGFMFIPALRRLI